MATFVENSAAQAVRPTVGGGETEIHATANELVSVTDESLHQTIRHRRDESPFYQSQLDYEAPDDAIPLENSDSFLRLEQGTFEEEQDPTQSVEASLPSSRSTCGFGFTRLQRERRLSVHSASRLASERVSYRRLSITTGSDVKVS